MIPKKVYIYTLGCKANQADSDRLVKEFLVSGCEIVDVPEEADISIVNTCTVTSKAAYQSRQAIRRVVKKNPRAKVIAVGCDAEYEKTALKKIAGVSEVTSLQAILSSLRALAKQSSERDAGWIALPSASSGLLTKTARSRPFLKIQDGCESFCSYCIIPYVRGKLWSMPADDVIREIKAISSNGFYEVVLTGIHIGRYGMEMGGNFTLTDLLARILNETNISRIRLGSIEPDELSTRLIEFIRDSRGAICPHLHIPLQSGCDATLERMKRRYRTDDYRRVVEFVMSVIPKAAIGADIMTGFPGENESEAEATYRFIESLPLAYLHVFSYSDRCGTSAERLGPKVPEAVKRERTAALRMLSTVKRTAYLKANLGKEVTVVFDRLKKGAFWKGVSENYITVLVEGDIEQKNHHRVWLADIIGESMIGRI